MKKLTDREVKTLHEYSEAVEDLGGVVMLPEDVENRIDALKKQKIEKEAKEAQRIKERNASYYMSIDASDYMDEPWRLLDSVVDACCSQGCQVEPDGYCEHGHPSVLLDNGMI